MCTTDCFCYEGEGGGTRKKWEEKSEEEYQDFNRTKGPKMLIKKDAEGKTVMTKNGFPLEMYPL